MGKALEHLIFYVLIIFYEKMLNISPDSIVDLMYFQCELIVFDVLPTARGAIARCLIDKHGYNQIQVARKFGVTGSAISQYLKGVRGGSEVIENSPNRENFYKMIERAADAIFEGLDVNDVLCTICQFVKESGMIEELYIARGTTGASAACFECPRLNIVFT